MPWWLVTVRRHRRKFVIAALVQACLLPFLLAVLIVTLDDSSSGVANAACAVPDAAAAVTVNLSQLDAEQRDNAGIIIAEGRALGVPDQGIVVALVTARQEESLHNDLVPNNYDSVGLFQQRPSQSWGTVAQVGDPHYSSRKFYSTLLQVPGWESMPVTQAAQAVQRSGFPDAYARWEPLARAILAGASGTVAAAPTCSSGAAPAPTDPGPGPQGADHLVPRLRALEVAIRQQFPQFKDLGDWRPFDPYPDHPSGRAVDAMLPGDYRSQASINLGNQLADWVNANAKAFGLQYEIFEQRYRPAGAEWAPMADRGSDTANHRDHVHITVLAT